MFLFEKASKKLLVVATFISYFFIASEEDVSEAQLYKNKLEAKNKSVLFI
jgi:hypothetical protein